MGKIVVIGSHGESLTKFRGEMLRKFVATGHEAIACAPGVSGAVEETLRYWGVETYRISLDRATISVAKDVKTIVGIFMFLKNVKPDLVMSYTIKPVLYGSLCAMAVGIPLVCSIITGLGYAFVGKSWKAKVVGFIARILYRLAMSSNQVVFFQNPDDLELFRRERLLGKSTRATVINGSGVDIEYFRPTGFPRETCFLLIARLLKGKGIYEYAAAARIMRSRNLHVSFLLVGWIDQTPDAINKNDIDSWTREGIIKFLGKVDDVRPCIARSSVYVLPSYREGTPRTVLEAMAMGRPIITTDSPGCRETVEDGLNGFLVKVGDVYSLVDAIERFVAEPELIEKMGKESRRIAVEKYDVRKVNEMIFKTLRLAGFSTEV